MKPTHFHICLLLLLILFSIASAQVLVTVVPKPDPGLDPNIIMYNQAFERSGNTSGWIYDPTSVIQGPYRDLGQSFTPSAPMYLDKITVEVSDSSPQTNLNACKKAPFHLDIYQFQTVNAMETPIATLSSQAGHLPANLTFISKPFYLEFDIQNVPLLSGKIYAFLFKFDSLKVDRHLNLDKTEDADQYIGGRLLYTEFDGTDGRKNITYYKWKHGGGNLNRDLNFWIRKGFPTEVAQGEQSSPDEFYLAPNYPNPFNASTRFRFTLSRKELVTMEIMNILGQKVATLLHTQMAAGSHAAIWTGLDDNGRAMPSGVYYCHFNAGSFSQLRKLTLLR